MHYDMTACPQGVVLVTEGWMSRDGSCPADKADDRKEAVVTFASAMDREIQFISYGPVDYLRGKSLPVTMESPDPAGCPVLDSFFRGVLRQHSKSDGRKELTWRIVEATRCVAQEKSVASKSSNRPKKFARIAVLRLFVKTAVEFTEGHTGKSGSVPATRNVILMLAAIAAQITLLAGSPTRNCDH